MPNPITAIVRNKPLRAGGGSLNRTFTPIANAAAKTVATPPDTLALKPAICPIGSIAKAFKFPRVSPA